MAALYLNDVVFVPMRVSVIDGEVVIILDKTVKAYVSRQGSKEKITGTVDPSTLYIPNMSTPNCLTRALESGNIIKFVEVAESLGHKDSEELAVRLTKLNSNLSDVFQKIQKFMKAVEPATDLKFADDMMDREEAPSPVFEFGL